MKRKRDAFTLVEMLIVLAIIAALAALVAFTFPSFQERSRAAKGGQALQAWLNYARQRALMEQAPRGLRFMISPSALTGGFVVRECQYLEQPDDYTGGTLLFEHDPSPGAANPPTKVKLTGGGDLAAIEKGDYLEIYGTGQVHVITGIDPSIGTLFFASSPLPPSRTLDVGQTEFTTHFRIMRRPRVTGDEPLKLPEEVVVDYPLYAKYENPAGKNLNAFFPPRVPNDTSPQYFDILFAPNGALIGSAGAMTILWVRTEKTENDAASPPPEFRNNPTLIVVYAHSGAVAAFDPVAGNVYAKIQ
jgi:prepilin-type N-terminal cleavage/methylation domain-containing protein